MSGAGSVTDSYLYDSFGNVISGGTTGTTSNPFRYVGRLGYYVSPALVSYYLRARIYRPNRGAVHQS